MQIKLSEVQSKLDLSLAADMTLTEIVSAGRNISGRSVNRISKIKDSSAHSRVALAELDKEK